jgi:4-nitrophenyl phosphatase
VTWALDCDGVVWLADEPIPGATQAIERVRAAGERVIFLTNNSWPRRADHVSKLEQMGIAATPEDVITSAMAAARLVAAGERVLVLGGPGLHEALELRGAEIVEPGAGDPTSVSAVVVGMDLGFDFDRLTAATAALRSGGARLIATNDDATFPTARGLMPGAGSVVAAVSTAGGREPEIAGKPFEPVATVLREVAGEIGIMVGDRPSTDGRFARLLGVRFGLVLTGVTKPGHGALEPAPDVEAADLAALVALELAR